MAILGMYSWDYLSDPTTVPLFLDQKAATVSAVTSRTGPNSLRLASSVFDYGRWTAYVGSTTNAWIQSACLFTSNNTIFPAGENGGTAALYLFSEDSINHIVVGFNQTTKALEARRGSNPGTLLASSAATGLLAANVWHSCAADVFVDDTVGRVTVDWDGVRVIDFTGDTRNGGTGYIDRVRMEALDPSNSYTYHDDVVIGNGNGDNDHPPGDCRVQYIVPNGEARSQFVPSSGLNYTNVDDAPAPDDANYNSSREPGEMDLFAMQDLAGQGLVYGVQTIIRARKDDAGTRFLGPVFRKSVNADGDTIRTYRGTDFALSDSFAYWFEVFEQSPDTGAGWSVDEVADIEFGYMIGGAVLMTVDAEIVGF